MATALPTPSRVTQLKYAQIGRCQGCGKRKPATETLCRECAEKHRQATNGLKLRLIEAGLCSQCGHEPLATVRLCRKCQDRHNTRTTKYKADRRRHDHSVP